eukprot:12950613-Heterocapsa_arctica.AAC.1
MGFLSANRLFVTNTFPRNLAEGSNEADESDEQIHTHRQDNGGRLSQRDFILDTEGPAIYSSVDPDAISDHDRVMAVLYLPDK